MFLFDLMFFEIYKVFLHLLVYENFDLKNDKEWYILLNCTVY